jgi:ATP-dependent protease ClpP protease subunit
MTETSVYFYSNFAKARARGLLDLGEILIDGDIEPHSAICSATIRAAINKLPPDEPIVLRFKKAAGGSFVEAIKINLMLRDSGRKVIAHVEQAASAATIVALAASEVTMVADGEFMIHDPYFHKNGFDGLRKITIADLQFFIDSIGEDREILLDIYTKRTGTDRAKIAELMRLTSFLKPEEALKHGFVDRILPAIPQPETSDVRTCADCPCHGKGDGAH